MTILAVVPPIGAQFPLPDLPVRRLERVAPTVQVKSPTLPVRRLAAPSPLDGPQKISVTFARATPVRDVLRLLVRATPYSIVTATTADPTFAGELRDLTVRQALEAVLFSTSLDYAIAGSVIQVFPRRHETRIFEVNLVPGRGGSGGVFAEIEAGVAALLSSGGRRHVDRRAGLVQVTDFADRLEQVAVYLESVQLRAVRQVRLDARVVEVRHEAGSRGLDWQALASTPGSGVRSAAAAAGVLVDDFDALLRALARAGSAALVHTARLVATNNEPAIVRLGASEPHTGDALVLVVTAQVGPDGIVQLSVAPALSREAGETGGGGGLREADTTVRVREGETVMLSGSTLDGPPSGRTELVLFVTPTIVSPGAPTGLSPAAVR